IVAEGGYVKGARVPPLGDATPTQVVEAVRTGPYLMPRFSAKAISDRQLDSIVAYVQYTKHPDDRGGWALGHIGPVPEGLVAWLIAAALLAAALIVTGKRLVAQEQLEEDYPKPREHEQDEEAVVQLVEESGDRFTRKRLLVLGAGAAGTALGAALIVPAASLGPFLDVDPFFATPWRRGRRLVDEAGRPLRAADIERDTFYTAYPEGADREQLASPLVIGRLQPAALHLPSGRQGWAPGGILAYSKICTHAGCAVALYRKPTFPAVEP